MKVTRGFEFWAMVALVAFSLAWPLLGLAGVLLFVGCTGDGHAHWPPQDFGEPSCDTRPACGDGADPDRVFPDLGETD